MKVHWKQDLTHQPQEKIIAGNRGQDKQEKARCFTRLGMPGAPECPISVKEKTIERTTGVGNRVEEHQPGYALRRPEPEQAIERE